MSVPPQSIRRTRPGRSLRIVLAGAAWLSSTCFPAFAQTVPAAPQPAQAPLSDASKPSASDLPPASKKPTTRDRRRATKAYLAAGKLYAAQQFEPAMHAFEEASALDPANTDYRLAIEVARSHAVTELIQTAAKDRIRGDSASARAALAHALEIDPKNVQITEHLHQLGDDRARDQVSPLYRKGSEAAGEDPDFAPAAGTHSFHLHTDARQAIQEVYKAFGVTPSVDTSVRGGMVRFDVDDANFQQAARLVSLVTGSFYVPLDAHRILVARDTSENRRQFMRQDMETVYLPGLTTTELTDIGNLAKNLFEASESVVEQSAGTLTIRAPRSTLNAFNATMRDLLDGHSQVLLDVRMIQLAHNNERTTGAQLSQQMGVFNVYAEAQSLISQNQSLVQEIVSSGLAAPGDYGAILAILLASGQVSSTLFSNGAAIFGGNCSLAAGGTCSPTAFALSPGPATLTLNLNSSDSRELDQLELRLGDGETGTLRSGTRYPITTSSFSSLSGSVPNIPGLNTAGASSTLSSLLASYSSSVPNIPMVEYQDLGLTLKATPKVLRNDDVALTVDLKITALAGQSLNGVPVLNNRAYSGVVTIKQGESVVVASEVDRQESRAISGTPGLSEIPGLNNITSKDVLVNSATLLVVMTPHILRGTQYAGHSQIMRVERSSQPR